ncbi:MAG TPA: tRNA (guanosine(46)-N7)-methyltransferase TrmB [Candidatus Saccharimonadia bacterium]|nr:tRNA (guanosine(46)-N7)-methyltransferase TrmB [Candidatus Saccharimonadia bacterium]
MTETQPHRAIRSFVLRQGRVTPAQARAFDAHWPHYGIEYAGAPRDFSALFGRTAPLRLEVGFGNGEQLHHAAANEPEADHLGIEVHGPGVGRVLNALANDRLENARVYRHDAVEVLQHEVPDAALDAVRIYFPDPWPKTRHHKRRLIQASFAALVAAKLKPGGLLHLATDWQDYAVHMLAVLDASECFRNRAGRGGFVERPPWRRETHFERRGKRLGHGVWDLVYERGG